MLNLLIVEDERIVREGLITMIDWADLGIRVCAQAENGMEAISYMDDHPIDLLLTDIRMPIVDGLQLIEQAQKRNPEIACVLLSGFSDFAYAQKALRLGVSDYLVKPCSPRDVKNVFQKIVSRMEDKRLIAQNLTGLQSQLRMNRTLAKSHLLHQWLETSRQPGENRKALMQQAQMLIAYPHVFVVVLEPERKSIRELNYSAQDLELLKYAVRNIVQETLEHALLQPIETVIKQYEVIAVCNGTYELTLEKLNTGLYKLQQNLQQYLHVRASIGVSDSMPTIDYMDEAYRQAVESVQMRFYKGSGNFFFYRDVSNWLEHITDYPKYSNIASLEQSIIDHLQTNLFAEALNDAEEWLKHMQEPRLFSRSAIDVHACSLMARLSHLLNGLVPVDHEAVESLESLSTKISLIETWEELSGIVFQAIQLIVKIVQPNKASRRKTQHAIEYISQNYNSPGISLSSAAKELFVSSTYLSTLFKQELGVNFLDYLHQYRIEKAKALLQEGEYKIQAIAKKVGYFDEAHFTKTFKKWVGMLPSQYKKNMNSFSREIE